MGTARSRARRVVASFVVTVPLAGAACERDLPKTPEECKALKDGDPCTEKGVECVVHPESEPCSRHAYVCDGEKWRQDFPTCNPPPPTSFPKLPVEACKTLKAGDPCQFKDSECVVIPSSDSCHRHAYVCDGTQWREDFPTCNPPSAEPTSLPAPSASAKR